MHYFRLVWHEENAATTPRVSYRGGMEDKSRLCLIEGGIPLQSAENEQIHSDLHNIGNWGSVLSSKHASSSTPMQIFFLIFLLSPLNLFLVETLTSLQLPPYAEADQSQCYLADTVCIDESGHPPKMRKIKNFQDLMHNA
jgi:hypothetical protein